MAGRCDVQTDADVPGTRHKAKDTGAFGTSRDDWLGEFWRSAGS